MALAFDTQTLQNAATSGDGSPYDTNGTARELVFWIIGTGTITGGEITIEEAHDAGYGGTWSVIDVVSPIGGAVTPKRYSGCFRVVRARITSAIEGGGSVTVLLDGNEEE